MSGDKTSRIAVVTGAGSGIGRAATSVTIGLRISA